MQHLQQELSFYQNKSHQLEQQLGQAGRQIDSRPVSAFQANIK